MTAVLESAPIEAATMPAPFAIPTEAEAAAGIALLFKPDAPTAPEVSRVLYFAVQLAGLNEPDEVEVTALDQTVADCWDAAIATHIAPTGSSIADPRSNEPEQTAQHVVFDNLETARAMGYRESEEPKQPVESPDARARRLNVEADLAKLRRPLTFRAVKLLIRGLEMEAAIGDPTAPDEIERITTRSQAQGVLDAVLLAISLPAGENQTLPINFPEVA